MSKKYSTSRLLCNVIVITILAVLSFWIAWAVEEGSSTNGFLVIISKTVYLFGFPSHVFFQEYIDHGITFFLGIIINALCYAIAIEALFAYVKNRRANTKNQNLK